VGGGERVFVQAMIYQGMKDKVKNEQAGTIPNAKGSDGKKP